MISADELRRSIDALQSLPQPTLERLAGVAAERRYATRRVIYRAGDVADGLYLVLSGRVRVSRELPSRAQMLHSESAGGVLGEIPVFGGGTFPATAVAVELTRCAHIPAAAIERLLREDPEFARFALRRLAMRAQSLLKRIDELSSTTVTSRVATHMLARATLARAGEITLGMSQEALAAELGTAREVIVRSLASLVRAGALRRAGRSRFVVARPNVLRAIAGGDGSPR